MHGVNRDAQDYREDWAEWARREKAVLLVPEFDEAHWPGSRAYNLGNRFDAEGRQLPPEQWSFQVIERIFDAVVAELRLEARDYALFGHSAGAQFVQRMVLCLPEARIRMAVAANAGWYTLPDGKQAWPYGLGASGVTAAALQRALGLPLCILLGERDVDDDDPNLRRTEEAMHQGLNRLERGRSFFEAARVLAADRNWTFGWELATVPGVGHSHSGMQAAAARRLAR